MDLMTTFSWIPAGLAMLLLISGKAESAVRSPFPHNHSYAQGIAPSVEPQEQANARVQQFWESFRSSYIVEHGTNQHRVLYKNSNTCSEAIAYGMLFSVLMENATNDTQEQFDGLLRFYKNNLNNFGLMCWEVLADGTQRAVAATDADEDVAMALMFADTQWGSSGEINYLDEARTVLSNLAYIVRAPYCFFPPADAGNNGILDHQNDIEWRKDKIFNPSYFSPAWYREFHELSGDAVWTNCLEGSYSVVEGFLNQNGNGILPDWCDPVTLGVSQVSPYDTVDHYAFNTNSAVCPVYYVMDYDGFRTGWRLGLDGLWNGNALAQSNCTALARFLDTSTERRPDKIKAYLPDGTQIQGSWNELAFTAPVAVAAMADTNGQVWLDQLYTSVTTDYTDTSHDKYFGRAQQLLAMLILSGNFPNLAEATAPDKEIWLSLLSAATGGTVTVSAVNLPLSATNILQRAPALTSTNWQAVGQPVTGISATNWPVAVTNAAMFFRLAEFVPEFGTDSAVISIDLGSNEALETGDSAGIVPAASWNHVFGYPDFSNAALNFSDGTASISADFSGNFTTRIGITSDENTEMFNRGGGVNSGDGSDITVSGLPTSNDWADGYDVYVYFAPGSADNNTRTLDLTIGATIYYAELATGSSNYSGSFDLVGSTLNYARESGNIVKFSGLTGSAFTLTATANVQNTIAVTGLQIVP